MSTPSAAPAAAVERPAAAAGAALALREVAQARDATIKSMGTPAEESGGGTVLLVQRGVFDDVTMAMMLQLAPEDACARTSQLEARVRACFEAEVLATECAHEVSQVGPGLRQASAAGGVV